MLPPATTLHVRVVAPLADRVAYMSQWLRLTEDEAAEEVRQRDAGRTAHVLATICNGRRPTHTPTTCSSIPAGSARRSPPS